MKISKKLMTAAAISALTIGYNGSVYASAAQVIDPLIKQTITSGISAADKLIPKLENAAGGAIPAVLADLGHPNGVISNNTVSTIISAGQQAAKLLEGNAAQGGGVAVSSNCLKNCFSKAPSNAALMHDVSLFTSWIETEGKNVAAAHPILKLMSPAELNTLKTLGAHFEKAYPKIAADLKLPAIAVPPHAPAGAHPAHPASSSSAHPAIPSQPLLPTAASVPASKGNPVVIAPVPAVTAAQPAPAQVVTVSSPAPAAVPTSAVVPVSAPAPAATPAVVTASAPAATSATAVPAANPTPVVAAPAATPATS